LTSSIEGHVWNVQLSILDSLHSLVQKIPKGSWTGSMVDTILEACWASLFNMKYSAIRTAAMKALSGTIQGLKGKQDRNGWLKCFNADTFY
jgi:hypothetical protein